MANRDLVNDFLNGDNSGKGSNLIIGKVLINDKEYLALLSYGYYPVGIITIFGVFIIKDKYSQTTATHIGYLVRALIDKGYSTDKKTYALPVKDLNKARPDFLLYRNKEIVCIWCNKRLNNITENCQPFDNCKEV